MYKLTTLAYADIEALFKDSVIKFGKKQAIKYLESLNAYLLLLSKNPEIGRNRDEIRNGLFSFPYKSHIIFFRIFKTHIRIVRVLHGSKDIIKFL